MFATCFSVSLSVRGHIIGPFSNVIILNALMHFDLLFLEEKMSGDFNRRMKLDFRRLFSVFFLDETINLKHVLKLLSRPKENPKRALKV